MNPSQLPKDNKYFDSENDFRPVLSGLGHHLHAIVHFRNPDNSFKESLSKIYAAERLLGVKLYGSAREKAKSMTRGFRHIVVAVGTNGSCYVGTAQVNRDSDDQYNKHFGFRLATKKALVAMENSLAVDFEIGIEPPNGKALTTIIGLKLKQFGILRSF